MNLEELKSELAKQEKALANPKLVALMGDKIQAKVDTLKKQISEMESKAENKVEDAQQKVEDAQQKVDDATTTKEKKEAQQEVKEAKKEEQEAKKEVKEVQQTSKQVEQVEKKVEKKIHGGKRFGSGRPKGAKNKKASSPTKMKKPDGVRVRPMPKRRRKKIVRVKKERKMPVRKMPVRKAVKKDKEEMKTVRAFGKSIQYKNNAEFCKKLINAFKKRKVASRSKKRKTKPVFGVITQGVKNAVSKALHNVPKKQIEKNPKEFLAKAQRLEKSAIKFLEDFKSILGSDYKKSEITSEFGELEKTIKSFVSKYTKK